MQAGCSKAHTLFSSEIFSSAVRIWRNASAVQQQNVSAPSYQHPGLTL